MNEFKKWILLFIGAIIISLLLVFLINYTVDPFGVFGDNYFRWYSYNIVNNPRIGKITYLDDYHQNYNSYIIGGSKSSSISPELLNKYFGNDTSFYSMMMYGGEFHDYEMTVKYLIENYEVKNIIVHMSTRELAIYNEDPKINNTMKAEVEGTPAFKYYWRFLTLDLKHSVQKLEGYVRRNYDPFEYGYIIPETGVYDKSKRDIEINETVEEFINKNPEFNIDLGKLEAKAIDNNLSSLKNIKDYCDSHNVDFMFIIAPTYDKEVEQFTKDEFNRFLRGAAQISDYWNFSGYTSIGNDARNFYDPLHYRNRIGEMMLARIFNNKDIYVPDDFGYYITNGNIEEYLEKRHYEPVQSLSKININLPILVYHKIQEYPVEDNKTIISYNKFKNDMTWLKNNGFNTVFFQDIIDYIKGRSPLPKRPVIITFDDGYLSDYDYAYPVLKRLNMKATLFIIGWAVGRDKRMDDRTPIHPHFSWEQAKEMLNSGLVDIQSHTYDLHKEVITKNNNRRGINKKPDETYGEYKNVLAYDNKIMTELFEKNLGRKFIALSYPYGEYSDFTINVLKELNISVSVTTVNDTNNIYLNMYNLYNLNRINMFEDTDFESMSELMY